MPTPIRNLVCLDVDGVLNHHQWFSSFVCHKDQQRANIMYLRGKPRSRYHIWSQMADLCAWNIRVLNELCHRLKASILLTSTWRRGDYLWDLQKVLEMRGLNVDIT